MPQISVIEYMLFKKCTNYVYNFLLYLLYSVESYININRLYKSNLQHGTYLLSIFVKTEDATLPRLLVGGDRWPVPARVHSGGGGQGGAAATRRAACSRCRAVGVEMVGRAWAWFCLMAQRWPARSV